MDRLNMESIAEKLLANYTSANIARLGQEFDLPSMEENIHITKLLLELLYPGLLYGGGKWRGRVQERTKDLLFEVIDRLTHFIYQCMKFYRESSHVPVSNSESSVSDYVFGMVSKLPEIRLNLSEDIQAAYEGDPSFTCLQEVVLTSPGVLATSVYRLAHVLVELKVPIMPRMMSQWAHSITGIDIHPAAKIGRRFFIDHGTGVVIGETAEVGRGVKIYQGVTLGAISFTKDNHGSLIRGTKRHPTVHDNVTIYANATILGGETVIGRNCIIGASVFLTESVAEGSIVINESNRVNATRLRYVDK